jgi:excisionase family DNA binding protein
MFSRQEKSVYMNITLCYFYPESSCRNEEGPMSVEAKQSILKTRDLAILLDLSPDVVNDMARRGHLKGFKSGNQWRFRRRDVERYLERVKKMAPPG